jgi:hypothetical protein
MEESEWEEVKVRMNGDKIRKVVIGLLTTLWREPARGAVWGPGG